MSSGNFEVENFKQLPQASEEELKRMEVQIQDEFKTIVKQYLEGRLSRIDHLLGTLESQVKSFQDNDKSWSKIYGFETETIENIKLNQESIIGGSRNGIRNYNEFEEEVIEIIKNIQSPLQVDQFLSEQDTLAFNHFLQPSVDGAIKDLTTISNESKYQIQLINDETERTKVLIWLSYREKLLSRKNQLIAKHLDELQQLTKEHNQETKAKHYVSDWNAYHNSVLSINDVDKGHMIDTSFEGNTKLNRIELTNIKNNILRKPSPQLHHCEGLTEQEIDEDLNIMKGSIPQPTQIIYKSPIETHTPLSTDFQDAYNQLLSPASGSRLPELPPFDYFD